MRTGGFNKPNKKPVAYLDFVKDFLCDFELFFLISRKAPTANKIKTIDIFDETPIKENYDAITCFEVLQHVVNPQKTLLHLINHLNSKGILFITTRFKNNYSLALKHNEHLENTFEEMIKKVNLVIEEKIHMWGEGDSSKFLYVLKTKV